MRPAMLKPPVAPLNTSDTFRRKGLSTGRSKFLNWSAQRNHSMRSQIILGRNKSSVCTKHLQNLIIQRQSQFYWCLKHSCQPSLTQWIAKQKASSVPPHMRGHWLGSTTAYPHLDCCAVNQAVSVKWTTNQLTFWIFLSAMFEHA